MTGFESFYSSVDATGPGVTHIGPESGTADSITLKICGHRLLIVVTGEPSVDLLLEYFRQGLARQVLHPNMRTLADVRKFVGVVDWTSLSRLRTLALWGEDTAFPARTAYLLRDTGAAMMVKAASALFPQAQHRAFTERQDAVAWLEAASARPPLPV